MNDVRSSHVAAARLVSKAARKLGDVPPDWVEDIAHRRLAQKAQMPRNAPPDVQPAPTAQTSAMMESEIAYLDSFAPIIDLRIGDVTAPMTIDTGSEFSFADADWFLRNAAEGLEALDVMDFSALPLRMFEERFDILVHLHRIHGEAKLTDGSFAPMNLELMLVMNWMMTPFMRFTRSVGILGRLALADNGLALAFGRRAETFVQRIDGEGGQETMSRVSQ